MEKHIMEVSGYRQLSGCQHSSKYLQQKKETHTGLEKLKGEEMMIEFELLSLSQLLLLTDYWSYK